MKRFILRYSCIFLVCLICFGCQINESIHGDPQLGMPEVVDNAISDPPLKQPTSSPSIEMKETEPVSSPTPDPDKSDVLPRNTNDLFDLLAGFYESIDTPHILLSGQTEATASSFSYLLPNVPTENYNKFAIVVDNSTPANKQYDLELVDLIISVFDENGEYMDLPAKDYSSIFLQSGATSDGYDALLMTAAVAYYYSLDETQRSCNSLESSYNLFCNWADDILAHGVEQQSTDANGVFMWQETFDNGNNYLLFQLNY